MKSRLKGDVPLLIPGIASIEAHQMEGLVEPLLSVSEVTDHGIGVVFLKEKVLFVKDERDLGSMIENQCSVVTAGPREGRSHYLEKGNQVRAF